MAGQINIVFAAVLEINEKMTVLQALQAMLEYKNDNLLAKALIDNGVSNSSATYTIGDEKTVDLAAADIYLILCNHPSFREGSKYIDYSKGTLMSLRRELLRKHGLLSATITVPIDSQYQKVW
jgi:hypothetical protein